MISSTRMGQCVPVHIVDWAHRRGVTWSNTEGETMRYPLITVLCLMVSVSLALADTVVWSFPDPPQDESIPVDLDTNLVGIIGVDVHMSGFGGGQHGYCQQPGGPNLPQNFSLRATIDLGGTTAIVDAPYMEDYDLTVPLELTVEQPDWSFLEDGISEVSIATSHTGYYDMEDCYPTGYDELTAPTFEIIVTAGTVPTDRISWSTVKARYR